MTAEERRGPIRQALYMALNSFQVNGPFYKCTDDLIAALDDYLNDFIDKRLAEPDGETR